VLLSSIARRARRYRHARGLFDQGQFRLDAGAAEIADSDSIGPAQARGSHDAQADHHRPTIEP